MATSMSRATSPLYHDNDNGGLKVWHLTRHEWDNDKEGERHNKIHREAKAGALSPMIESSGRA